MSSYVCKWIQFLPGHAHQQPLVRDPLLWCWFLDQKKTYNFEKKYPWNWGYHILFVKGGQQLPNCVGSWTGQRALLFWRKKWFEVCLHANWTTIVASYRTLTISMKQRAWWLVVITMKDVMPTSESPVSLIVHLRTKAHQIFLALCRAKSLYFMQKCRVQGLFKTKF